MILSVEQAGFAYRDGQTVLHDIDLSLSSGQLLAILGPNGAGKTTLLRCIMGFLPWSQGCSRLDGSDIRSLNRRQLWQRVAYVPQARGVSSSLSAEEMILLGRSGRLSAFSHPGEAERQRVRELADELGIERLLNSRCSELSGGELQMVLIARALIAEPELLILDEPESNLDFKNQLIVLDAMSRLTENGMACIFNTHYPTHALLRAHKSLLLHRGGEALFGDTSAIVTEANIERAFGVHAVIGEIETPQRSYRSVLPLNLSAPSVAADAAESADTDADRQVIAVIAAIFSDSAAAARINSLLHEYSGYIVGRMGIPYREGGVHIINATLDAPPQAVERLTHQLGLIPGVSAKTTVAERR